jgi:hypothetical protein
MKNKEEKNKQSHHCYVIPKKEEDNDCERILKEVIFPLLPPSERFMNFLEKEKECLFFVIKSKHEYK